MSVKTPPFWLFICATFISSVSAVCTESKVDATEVPLPVQALVQVTKSGQALKISVALKKITGRIDVDCRNETHCEIGCVDAIPPLKVRAWQEGTAAIHLGQHVTNVEVNRCFVNSDEGFVILRHLFRNLRQILALF